MCGDPNNTSSCRVSCVTAIIVLAVAATIALANLASEPVNGDHITRLVNGPHRAYGWPLTWYWAVAWPNPGGIKPLPTLAARPVLQWLLVRYSASRLAADLAIWLVLLAGAAVATRRLLRRYRFRWKPRWTTLVLLPAVAAPLVFANMSFETDMRSLTWERGTTVKALFGWPMIWNWYFVAPFDNVYGWDFSAPRLAGNIAIWLMILALAASAWEWRLRRHPPRRHFNLRAMMAAVALVSVACAWCVTVRKRANEQDALAESLGNFGHVGVERWGPKWVSIIVPDRFRRRVVAVSVDLGRGLWVEDEEPDADDNEVQRQPDKAIGEVDVDESDAYTGDSFEDGPRRDEWISALLGRLASLRSLHVSCRRLTPATADALANLRQLRALGLDVDRDDDSKGPPVDIAWLGKLDQLEYASLTGVGSDELACLTGLTHLESLAVDLSDCADDEAETGRRLAAIGKLTWLRRVRLEGSPSIGIAHLSNLTNLESLSIEFDRFPGDQEELRQCFAEIGKMTQLERLRLSRSPDQGGTPRPLWVRSEDLATLRGLTNLTSLTLQIACDKADSGACLAALRQLTQLRRLWLDGDLVGGGVSELATLTWLQELTSDHRMATPTAIESLSSLKRLRAVHIAGLQMDLATSNADSDRLHRAVESLRQSHPRLIIDGDCNERWLEQQEEDSPWFRGEDFDDRSQDLDSFLGFIPFFAP